ncbi:MAG: hypothetical protein IAE79_07605 [Anaerolinea sp.]|nr:hypothetical protein [Anaerolinea sp.]
MSYEYRYYERPITMASLAVRDQQGAAVQALINETAERRGGVNKQVLVFWAELQHIPYRQYQGHWDGREWEVRQVRSRVVTKAGVAFEPGDWVLCKKEGFGIWARWTAYSFRNACDTAAIDNSVVVRRHVQ